MKPSKNNETEIANNTDNTRKSATSSAEVHLLHAFDLCKSVAVQQTYTALNLL
jgi:hypothetical protein